MWSCCSDVNAQSMRSNKGCFSPRAKMFRNGRRARASVQQEKEAAREPLVVADNG